LIATQPVPSPAHCFHWKVVIIGRVPSHLGCTAWSGTPTWAGPPASMGGVSMEKGRTGPAVVDGWSSEKAVFVSRATGPPLEPMEYRSTPPSPASTKRTWAPSAVHVGSDTFPAPVVSATGPLPSAFITTRVCGAGDASMKAI